MSAVIIMFPFMYVFVCFYSFGLKMLHVTIVDIYTDKNVTLKRDL